MSDESRTVRIGDRDVRIARFRGLKAVLAMALVARVMREVPEIQERLDEYVRGYRDKNKVVITPAMAKLPRFIALGLTPEDFQSTGGNIEFPDEPSQQQVFVAMVPDLFDLARKELTRFIALLEIPNSELEEADDADAVEEALDKRGKALFREGDVDELLELMVVGWEVFQEQIQSKQEKLGKLRNLPFLRMLQFTPPETEPEPEEIQPIFPEESPTSSTDSEPSTDGTAEQLSMVSPGPS